MFALFKMFVAIILGTLILAAPMIGGGVSLASIIAISIQLGL